MQNKTDYESLLNEYRTLWNNRELKAEESPENILKEAVARELKDENSHPRIRKPIADKFYLAVKRIIQSDLDIAKKGKLVEVHIEIYELIK
ncbi:hypothetical protein [Cytobacillus purgationiresistens]|uniref:YojE n=1 Tax=Cytobacillus purgationiresistens TaxID=863449 RepID=A0ABU0AR18_9BACI|nr:hypothetical protein [Cytobacillus purgationiresistens]MDQ0273714.1 hypothetical protein [Cytobacillus purgationiresistens]